MWAAFARLEDLPNLGHEALNDEHENIVRLMNELHNAILLKVAVIEQRRLLNELESYVRVNNRSEEQMMETDLYPSRENHRKAHEGMYRRIYEYGKVLQAGLADNSLQGLHALREALIGHIKQEDERIASWHRIHSPSPDSAD